MPSQMPKLKPCPFCKEIPFDAIRHDGSFELLHRKGCFLSQNLAFRDPQIIYEIDFKSWNTRTGDTA